MVYIIFILFYLARIEKDNQKEKYFISRNINIFLALAFLSFAWENIVYDATLSKFVTYNEANYYASIFFGFRDSLNFCY